MRPVKAKRKPKQPKRSADEVLEFLKEQMNRDLTNMRRGYLQLGNAKANQIDWGTYMQLREYVSDIRTYEWWLNAIDIWERGEELP